MTDQLFDDAPSEPAYGVRNGRYQFPPPPGEQANPRGWMRTSNLVSAFSDQRALQLWLEWKAMLGLREHDHIFDEWMAEPLGQLDVSQAKALANLYAEKARQAVKADEGARRGTARHLMVETFYVTGEITGTRSMRAQLDSLREQLDAKDLDVIETELTLWNPIAGGVMGRTDLQLLCRRTGQVGTGDLKTQAQVWTWQEICGQMECYDSATWAWRGPHDASGHWEKKEPGTLLGRPGTHLEGKRVALVAHMPQAPGPGQLPVTIKQIPLDYGREVLECAARNVELRSRGRSAGLPVEDFPA